MNMQSRVIIVCVGLIILSLSNTEIQCYEKITHEQINTFILSEDICDFSLNDYLMNNVGLIRGVKHELADRPVIYNDWFGVILKAKQTPERCISEGGRDEDSPFIRCKNHFHDPLKEWSRAGLYEGGVLAGGDSSILWAQREEGTQYLGNYSWHDVRQYFYRGLTSSEDKERAENLIKTFNGVGRLMHLVQDSSVPEHVRNDGHVLPILNFEKYLSGNEIHKWLINQTCYAFMSSAFSLPPNTHAPVPVARIVDTDRYDGTNPDVTMTSPTGLAEYTNANYFSTDTVFTTDDYPYPSWESVNHTVIRVQDPRNEADDVHREYLVKMHHGDTSYRLCTAPVLYGQVPETVDYLAPILDENVYGDYAERLIPRAVSYSAGLLKYFFRGTLELKLPPDGVYCFRPDEPADPRTQGFDRVSLYVRNTTDTGEQMTGGSIDLVVKYRFLTDDPDAQDPRPAARDPFAQYTPENLPALSDPLYIVKKLDDRTDHQIPLSEPVLIEFDLSGDQIPLWAVDVSFSVVYRGRLGGGEHGHVVEEGAVCVGYNDVAEPTPLYVVNDTDTVCYNDEWRRASDLDDVTPTMITHAYIRFSEEGQPRDTTVEQGGHIHSFLNLDPGRYKRVYLLSDYRYNQSVHYVYHLAGESDVFSETATFLRQSIRSGIFYDQDSDALTRHYPVLDTFRNVTFWNMFYVHNPNVCTLDTCPGDCDYHDNPYELTQTE